MLAINKVLIFLGLGLIIISGGAATTVAYLNSQKRQIPIVFSDQEMLLETWNDYKTNNIDKASGRTIDKSRDDLTTSEGESYTMLRSVWMDDKTTFDSSWEFTQNNLQRPDHLFSWEYGKLANNSYGVLVSQGGDNTASDADEDIALSLLMAYTRWNDPSYLSSAQAIITNIWNEEVVYINGAPVMTADNLEKNNPNSVVVNPSYFAFANYKTFAKIDPTHDWQGLATNSYKLLNEMSGLNLDKSSSDGLPPDWVSINRNTGAITANDSASSDTNFGYDAMRIPFRLALDYSWYKDPRDKISLSYYGFLKQFWQNNGVENAIYAHDGSVVANYESPAMYGGTIGYFMLIDPTEAKNIYDTKLITLYSPDQQAWKAPSPSYYDDNWAWFGIALYNNQLPNLTAQGQ